MTQAIAFAGSDAVIIDFERGAIDYVSAYEVIAARARTQMQGKPYSVKLDELHLAVRETLLQWDIFDQNSQHAPLLFGNPGLSKHVDGSSWLI